MIISEWMGNFLLKESMLDTVLIARDRFLKPGRPRLRTGQAWCARWQAIQAEDANEAAVTVENENTTI